MRLLKLKLRNFKGIDSFELNAQGADVRVFGDNGTGKTTLADAFMWLLFDKDSKDQSQFEIKTLDANGEPAHHLEHEVEGVLELEGGKRLELRKVYYEKWTKKRGSATETFSGHTTDYYIDGVPVKKSEYDAKIEEIADEEIFKLLTNPAYFPEELHWQDRREILIDAFGTVTDEEVIASDENLAELRDILNGRGVEDHQKVVKGKQKEINKELDRLPVRIDEVTQGLPDIEDIDEDSLRGKIRYRKNKVRELEQELSNIESGGGVAEKKQRLAEVESEILDLKNQHREKVDKLIEGQREELATYKEGRREMRSEVSIKQRMVEDMEEQIEELDAKANELRGEWHKINEQEFEYDEESVCPTCGQDLPEEQLEEARQKALEDFNKEKAGRLEDITAEGKAARAEQEELREKKERLQQQIEDHNNDIETLGKHIEHAEAKIRALQEEATELEDNPEYQAKLEERKRLKSEIENLQADRSAEKEGIQEEIERYEGEISELERQLARLEQYEEGQARIEELKEKEGELAQEYERLEKELYLMEEFTRAKVSLLEEKINSQFELADFQVFEVQVNGGIKETWEVTYDGVPYGSNLNNGARINVGLDIINTLSDHYGFSAPLFIDNRESVTELIDTSGQMISLVVSPEDEELRIETEIKEAV